jgi:RNA-directed DNA polymerase
MSGDIQPSSFETLTARLATAMLAGPFDELALKSRCKGLFERSPRWLSPLINRVLDAFGTGQRPYAGKLIEFLRGDQRLAANWSKRPVPVRSCTVESHFAPATSRFERWRLPEIHSVGHLAEWLSLSLGHLEWFADRKQLGRLHGGGRLCHYRYCWQRKRHGRVRLIEAPKSRLKEIQRRLLGDIFSKIPVHEAAHGFRPGRSVLSFTAPHIGKAVVLKLDLSDFFPTTSPARLTHLLMAAGYPEEVARTISGLCTNSAPHAIWRNFPDVSNLDLRWQCRQLYQAPHFPQGAPTSPAIANLCSFRLDQRLAGLARVAGASYTRYADDLLFSGDREFARSVDSFKAQVAAIVVLEGHQVNHHKTRVMFESQCQFAAGVVLNDRPNISRAEFDRLKATLHQAAKAGPESQNHEQHPNYRSHLLGRIQWVQQLNRQRGDKLKRMFDQIAWND